MTSDEPEYENLTPEQRRAQDETDRQVIIAALYENRAKFKAGSPEYQAAEMALTFAPTILLAIDEQMIASEDAEQTFRMAAHAALQIVLMSSKYYYDAESADEIVMAINGTAQNVLQQHIDAATKEMLAEAYAIINKGSPRAH